MEPDIFEEIQRLRREGRKAVLATIVQIRGSVPSFNSAKMLVRDDGSTLGSVGGGIHAGNQHHAFAVFGEQLDQFSNCFGR